MRWSATICWCRDEAYGMVHANEVECNYLLVTEMKHMQLSVGTEMKHMAWCMLMISVPTDSWSATICWYQMKHMKHEVTDEAYAC